MLAGAKKVAQETNDQAMKLLANRRTQPKENQNITNNLLQSPSILLSCH